MDLFLLLIASVIKIAVWVLFSCLFLRAIIGLFPEAEENAFVCFVLWITEPIVCFSYYLLKKIIPLRELQFDYPLFISFVITAVLLVFL